MTGTTLQTPGAGMRVPLTTRDFLDRAELVDDADPVAVDQLGAVQEVSGGQGHAHAGSRGARPVGRRPLDVVPVTLTAEDDADER